MNKINNLAAECCGIHAKRNSLTLKYMDDTIRDIIGTIIKDGIIIENDTSDSTFIVHTRVNNSIENSRVCILTQMSKGRKK